MVSEPYLSGHSTWELKPSARLHSLPALPLPLSPLPLPNQP